MRSNYDEPVKSPPSRHTGESRYPELLGNTGFRVKHGMTKQREIDFLRSRQLESKIFGIFLSVC